MKVTILESRSTSPSRTDVLFISRFGQATACWAEKTPVVLGDQNVEFDVHDRVEWGRTAIMGNERTPSISASADGVRFCGTIDNVQDDGVVALRLGTALILLETTGESPPVGSTVCVTAKEVDLYPLET